VTELAAVPYASAIDTTSESYHVGSVVGELLLAACVVVVVWKLVVSISNRRNRKRFLARPMTYAATPYGPGPAFQHGALRTLAQPETSYDETVILPERRGPRGEFWIPAAMIVTLAACWFTWKLVSPDHPSASVPVGTGVSAAASAAEPPPGPGQVYRSTAGHFAVRFLSQPVEMSKSMTNQVATMTGHLLTDQPHGCGVEGVNISPGVPDSEIESALHGLVDGATSGGSVTREVETTFRGRPAYEADDETADGRTFTVEAVLYGSERAYIFIAPSGPTFAAMVDSFVALP
jgi:hypothetical protein